MASVLVRPFDGSTTFNSVMSGAQRHAGPLISATCLFIGLVSAYDAYLTMAYAPFLVHLESNPLGREIMSLDEGMFISLNKIAFFLGLKFAGTVCAMTAIQMLYHYRRRWAVPVAVALGVFQLLLLAYLQFGTR